MGALTNFFDNFFLGRRELGGTEKLRVEVNNGGDAGFEF